MAPKDEAGRGEDKQKVSFHVIYGEKNVTSAQTLELSLLGVGTVLRLERDACVVNHWLQRRSTIAIYSTLGPTIVYCCLRGQASQPL